MQYQCIKSEFFGDGFFFLKNSPENVRNSEKFPWEIQMQTISTNGDGVEGVHRALGLLWPCSRRSALVNSDSLVCLSGIVPLNVTWRTYITSAISIKVKWKMQHPLDSSAAILCYTESDRSRASIWGSMYHVLCTYIGRQYFASARWHPRMSSRRCEIRHLYLSLGIHI